VSLGRLSPAEIQFVGSGPRRHRRLLFLGFHPGKAFESGMSCGRREAKASLLLDIQIASRFLPLSAVGKSFLNSRAVVGLGGFSLGKQEIDDHIYSFFDIIAESTFRGLLHPPCIRFPLVLGLAKALAYAMAPSHA